MRGPHAKITKVHSSLNQLRCKRGLSLKDIADQIGSCPQVVSHWMTGKTKPRKDYKEKLAKVLGVSEEWIMDSYNQSIVDPPAKVETTAKPQKSDRISHYDNFWTNKRDDLNLTIIDVKNLTGLSKDKTTIAKYFTGELIPDSQTIKIFCDTFDVPFEEGKTGFVSGHDKWVAIRSNVKTAEITPKVNKMNIAMTTTITPAQKVEVTRTPLGMSLKNNPISKLIYEKVSFDEFCKILDAVDGITDNSASIPEMVYGKVDFDVFNVIYELVEGKNAE